MFSATLDSKSEAIAAQYLTNPQRITATPALKPAPKIHAHEEYVATQEKFPALLRHLKTQEGACLVFVKTKHRAKKLAQLLIQENLFADALHGDLRQNKREQVMQRFRTKKQRVLVATDIVARGVDISHISLVVNYDLPLCPEDYVHRIGRTGRAGATGQAVSLISPEEGRLWKDIQRFIQGKEVQSSHPKARKPRDKAAPGGRPQKSSRPLADKKRPPSGNPKNFKRAVRKVQLSDENRNSSAVMKRAPRKMTGLKSGGTLSRDEGRNSSAVMKRAPRKMTGLKSGGTLSRDEGRNSSAVMKRAPRKMIGLKSGGNLSRGK
jgi:superfamily II DNA/RNA helicase